MDSRREWLAVNTSPRQKSRKFLAALREVADSSRGYQQRLQVPAQKRAKPIPLLLGETTDLRPPVVVLQVVERQGRV